MLYFLHSTLVLSFYIDVVFIISVLIDIVELHNNATDFYQNILTKYYKVWSRS